MASYQVKVDLIFGEKGIVRGARFFYASISTRLTDSTRAFKKRQSYW